VPERPEWCRARLEPAVGLLSAGCLISDRPQLRCDRAVAAFKIFDREFNATASIASRVAGVGVAEKANEPVGINAQTSMKVSASGCVRGQVVTDDRDIRLEPAVIQLSRMRTGSRAAS
jgi:hypothetical protein